MNLFVLVIIGLMTISISGEEQIGLDYMNVCQVNDGFIQDQNNCRCFYQCDNEFRLWHMCCPDGQAFDQKSKVCTLEDQVVCDGIESLARVQRIPSSECYSPNALFRHNNCDKFYLCSYRQLYEMSCPHNTLWNDVLKTCVLPQFSTCNSFDLNPIQNVVIKVPQYININPANNQMPKQRINENQFVNNDRARNGGQHDEIMSQALENNKWLSSVTFLTLDPNGKVIYGITKVSKFSLDRVNETESLQPTDNPEELNKTQTDSRENSDESEDNSAETSEVSDETAINEEISETTTEGLNGNVDTYEEEKENTTETVATDSEPVSETENENNSSDSTTIQSETYSNDLTTNLENTDQSTTQSNEDITNTTPVSDESHTSSSTDSEEVFTESPENLSFIASKLVEEFESETSANTEESVTDKSEVTTDESTISTTSKSIEDTTESTESVTSETLLESTTEYTEVNDNNTTITTTDSANSDTESLQSLTENFTQNGYSTEESTDSQTTTQSNGNEANNEVINTTTESYDANEKLDSTKTEINTTEKTSDADENSGLNTTESPETTTESVTQTNEDLNKNINSSETTTEITEENTIPKIENESEEDPTEVITESNELSESTTLSIEKTQTELPESSTDTLTPQSSSVVTQQSIKSEETVKKTETGFQIPKADREFCKEVGGLYSDEKSCECFFVCDLAFRPYRHCCPNGLLFNSDTEECDHPDSVTCEDGSNRPLRLKRSIHYKHNVEKVKLDHLKFK